MKGCVEVEADFAGCEEDDTEEEEGAGEGDGKS